MSDSGITLNELRDCLLPPITAQDEADVQRVLEIAYGVEYDSNRIALLFGFMRDDGWSGQRLRKTAEWIIKHKPWAAWTPADWFQAPSESLHPHSWALEENHKMRGAMKRMQAFQVGEVVLWRYASEDKLPFKQIYPKQ